MALISGSTPMLLPDGSWILAGDAAALGALKRDPDGWVIVGDGTTVKVGGVDIKAGMDAGTRRAIAAQYGHFGAFIDHPEVGLVLRAAAQHGFDPSRLVGALSQTEWWKKKSDVEREWEALRATDEATANRRLGEQVDMVRAQAKRLGAPLAWDAATRIAESSIRFGWNQADLQRALVAQIDFRGEHSSEMTPGLGKDTVAALKQMANEYLVDISEHWLDKWTKQVMNGDVDIKSFEGYLRGYAKSQFPGLAAALDRGVTVRQFVDPFVQLAARELEITPDQIDLMDPKWSKPLFGTGKDGDREQMSLAEWQTELRTNDQYGWKYTKAARSHAYEMAEEITRTFGAIA